MTTPLSLAAVTLVFFLCNLVYWMNPLTWEGKFASGLWWFTAVFFLVNHQVKPELLIVIPYLLTWAIDLWISRTIPAWAERLRKGAQQHGNQ